MRVFRPAVTRGPCIRPQRSDIWHLKQEPFCGQSYVPKINHRIVGGSEANFGQFPWQAQIWTFKPNNDTPIFSCGGTLISDELILTAAHCVHFTDPERYTIILGRQYLDENYEICNGYEQRYRVVDLVVHSKFRLFHVVNRKLVIFFIYFSSEERAVN
jgi:hypothetical protein